MAAPSRLEAQIRINTSLNHEFNQEIRRFLSAKDLGKMTEQNQFWKFMIYLIEEFQHQIQQRYS